MLKGILTNLIWQNIGTISSYITNPKKLATLFKSVSSKTWQEIAETGNMLQILSKMAVDLPVTEQEKQEAVHQAKDLAKTIPAFGIFLLPGGAVLLPILAKVLPWDILPSSFSSNADTNTNPNTTNSDIISNTKSQTYSVEPVELSDNSDDNINTIEPVKYPVKYINPINKNP